MLSMATWRSLHAADTIELAWGLIDSIMDGWVAENGPKLQTYEPGSWGPAAADDFLASDNCQWLLGCGSSQAQAQAISEKSKSNA